MTENAIRILIVDDHPMFREGVSISLSEQPDLEVCGEGASADEAIRLDRELSPDIILLDLSMPGGGLHALRLILEQSPDARVVVLTASEADEDVLMALRSGARGYVLKGVPATTLIEVVRGVIAGKAMFRRRSRHVSWPNCARWRRWLTVLRKAKARRTCWRA